MKLAEGIYFYEGDYVDKTKKKYFHYYEGMASSNFMILKNDKDTIQTMIDSGMPKGPHVKRIQNEMKKEAMSFHKTNQILFSHCHPDHIMQAVKLSLDHNIAFFMHENNERMILNDDYFFEAFFNYPPFIQKEIFKMPKSIIKMVLKLLGMNFGYLKVDEYFNDTLPVDAGHNIEIIPLFAHCSGHVGYYFPDNKILYSGDLFDMRCASGADIIASTSDYNQAFRDIETVMELDIEIIIPGHGRMVRGAENIQSLLKEVYKNTIQYRVDILEILHQSKKPLSVESISRLIFKDTISYNAFSRIVIVYNVLKVLLKKGEVDFTIKNNKSLWFLLV